MGRKKAPFTCTRLTWSDKRPLIKVSAGQTLPALVTRSGEAQSHLLSRLKIIGDSGGGGGCGSGRG
ncbi:hypothetical protein E2C01_072994 [Portunus trituberculatus]|uniref:Uncharacterized protein n=1 Tax=Portunus trituberculatus TaxID=210409 RepID=A0A5B7I9E2_PORTR|nr:hypothetical protein [Portunus trituberculatus]